MTAAPETEIRYCLMVPGDEHPVETFPRDPEGFGAIQAVNRAHALSLLNGVKACSVYIGERFLVAYEAGRRVADAE
jgi:hypothetical protein